MARPPQPAWNGLDFYVILGKNEAGDPRWPIARDFGLLNAGDGTRFWKPLRKLQPGHRVFAYVSRAGYVGVGEVAGEMIPARDAVVEFGGRRQPLLERPELDETWRARAASQDPQRTEMVVAVNWLAETSVDQAISSKGRCERLFSNPTIACKLTERWRYTVTTVLTEFGLDTSD